MSESRKLQRLGGTSLYVSLPKRWTDKLQLKQGDKITLILQPDGAMSVYPTAQQEKPREIILDVKAEDSRQSLKRAITAAYVDGFDIIKMKAKERLLEEQHDIIREVIDGLFGLEVIEVTRNMITVQCLLKQTLPIEKTIQRIHNIIMSTFSETISALKEHDVHLVKGLTRRMHDIKRLSLVTHRLLRSLILFPRSSEQTNVTLIDCADYQQILYIINEIADNVNKISEAVVMLSEYALPKYIIDPLYQIFIHIQEFYCESIQVLLSKDVQRANRLLDSTTTLDDMWRLFIEANEKSEISSLTLAYAYLLIDNLKQIQRYATEIAEITIDRAEAETKKGY